MTKIILYLLTFLAASYSFALKVDNTIPVVLWHGMGDSCCNPLSLGRVKKLITSLIPQVYVRSLMVGNNVIEDTEHGFFSNMNYVIENVCEIIKADEKLSRGFHAMGFSQGGLFLRALVQHCPEAKVYSLVSIGGPQQGIYGLPFCSTTTGICNAVREMLQYGAYSPIIQKISVQAQYWHDPYVSKNYASKNIFLADINCANWFGYYAINNASTVQSFNKTELYKKDLIGLKTLHESGRLHLISVDGRHLQISLEELTEIINKFFKPNIEFK